MALPIAQPAPASPRMQALRNLSNQLPVANGKLAAGQSAARDMQVQQAVKSAPAAAPIQQTAQATGTAVAENRGQQLIQNATQQVQQQGQVGQLGLGQQAQEVQGQVAGLQSGARESAMDNVQRLASISEQAKQELYDRQMSFEKDQAGNAVLNERQLADYARINAKSDEDFKNYSQQAQQASQRALIAMEQAYKMVNEDLIQKYAEAEQKKDQESMKVIGQMQADSAARMQRERNRAANNAAAWNAAGTGIGGAVGGAIGQSASGAQAGSGVGGALGSVGSSIGI